MLVHVPLRGHGSRVANLATPILVLCLAAPGFASVAGSDHDLTGAGQKLCQACHIPHNAQGDALWATTPSGTFSGVADLCYTCHDGSVTAVGSTNVFDPTKENHLLVGPDCSGEGACHDVHDQNPNGTGRFTVVQPTEGSFCQTCHDDTPFPGAEALGDITAGSTHYTNGTTFTCNGCHSVHGAKVQTINPPGLTNPILLHNNIPGDYYGNFCVHCHLGVPPAPGVPGTGGVASSDPFGYTEFTNDGTETKHPTMSTTGPTPVGGCNKCHDVHDPDAGPNPPPYLLLEDNTDSAYCISCHTQAGAPSVGGNSHFIGVPTDITMNQGLSPALPWANQIDEDGNAGVDWPNATAGMLVCETCHSVHRQGISAGGGYFLRAQNTTANEICQACHTNN